MYAEGFGLKDIAMTKYSVSTKLPVYLGSAKLILAAGPEEIHAIKYLKHEKAAIVASDKNDFMSAVKKCFNVNADLLKNANYCAEHDFNKECIQKLLKDDIIRIAMKRGDCP